MSRSPDRASGANRILTPFSPRGRSSLSNIEYAARAGLAAVAVFAGVAGAKEASDPGSVSAPIARAATGVGEAAFDLVGGPTQAQKIAADLFKNAQEGQILTGIEVVNEQGVTLRDVPYSPYDRGPESTGIGQGKSNKVGHLKRGGKIPRAIVVIGNDVESPLATREGIWLAFPDPENPDRIVFAWGRYFSVDGGGEAFFKVAPFELKPQK